MDVTLEQLRSEWTRHADRLNGRLSEGLELMREDALRGHRERVKRGTTFGPFAMAVWIATLALLGHFLATHWHQPLLFAHGLVLDAWVIAAGVGQLRREQVLRGLDYGLPVVALQARVEELRIARVRAFNREFLTGQIVWWIPLLVVAFAGFGVDLYAVPGFAAFAAWNVAAGLAAIPLAIWLSRRYAERLTRHSWVRQIADSIAGRDIAEAREYLARLRRFESAD